MSGWGIYVGGACIVILLAIIAAILCTPEPPDFDGGEY